MTSWMPTLRTATPEEGCDLAVKLPGVAAMETEARTLCVTLLPAGQASLLPAVTAALGATGIAVAGIELVGAAAAIGDRDPLGVVTPQHAEGGEADGGEAAEGGQAHQ